MRTHLNGITALHLVVSLLYLLAAGFAFAGVLTLEELTGEKRIRTATQPPPPVAEQDTNWLAVKGAFTDTFGDPTDHLASSGPLLGVLLLLLAISSLTGAVGLLKYQPWARRLLIVLSVIQLLNFPLGTLLAGYTLRILLQKDTRQLFDGREGPVQTSIL